MNLYKKLRQYLHHSTLTLYCMTSNYKNNVNTTNTNTKLLINSSELRYPKGKNEFYVASKFKIEYICYNIIK